MHFQVHLWTIDMVTQWIHPWEDKDLNPESAGGTAGFPNSVTYNNLFLKLTLVIQRFHFVGIVSLRGIKEERSEGFHRFHDI